jgi:hypothetical protein
LCNIEQTAIYGTYILLFSGSIEGRSIVFPQRTAPHWRSRRDCAILSLRTFSLALRQAFRKEVLERTGAHDISSTGEATGDKRDKERVR